MKSIITCLFLLPVLWITQSVKISTRDFKPAFGNWKGTLTYLDYGSGKPYSMPANMRISKLDARHILLVYEYPEEPKANGRNTLVIGAGGRELDGAQVLSKVSSSGGGCTITTQEAGIDGNDHRSATIRHIYTISDTGFIIRKEVRFEGEKQFIMRNEYRMAEHIQ